MNGGRQALRWMHRRHARIRAGEGRRWQQGRRHLPQHLAPRPDQSTANGVSAWGSDASIMIKQFKTEEKTRRALLT